MEPQTLQEAIVFFSDPKNCREWIVPRRWPNGVQCPRCGGLKVTFLEKYNRWQCGARHASRQFTIKTGTIFEDSPLGLDKWLAAMWQVVNDRNGISSWEMHRALGVSQKTTWFMDHRIRCALTIGSIDKLSGRVEADETFIGGKARNMHMSKRLKAMAIDRRGGKTIAFGLLERGGKVRTEVVPDRGRSTLQGHIKKHVEPGAELFTDELHSYWGLEKEYLHQIVNHALEYVNGHIHTNGLENFWSLVKRALGGTYVSVEPFHLFRYLDEQAWRYNHRKGANGQKLTDAQRFDIAVRQIVGKRLTWNQVTGKVGETPAF
jgi:transposase-like protein